MARISTSSSASATRKMTKGFCSCWRRASASIALRWDTASSRLSTMRARVMRAAPWFRCFAPGITAPGSNWPRGNWRNMWLTRMGSRFPGVPPRGLGGGNRTMAAASAFSLSLLSFWFFRSFRGEGAAGEAAGGSGRCSGVFPPVQDGAADGAAVLAEVSAAARADGRAAEASADSGAAAAEAAEPAGAGKPRRPEARQDAAIETKLAGLVGRLKDAAGTNLESVLLYGSAARGEHREGKSDLNLLCTLVSLSGAELNRIAPAVNWWTNEQLEPSPLFFTESELRSAADVFAIELLDIQRDHRVLFGKDVVAGIHVPTNLHRIQVEHELRTML